MHNAETRVSGVQVGFVADKLALLAQDAVCQSHTGNVTGLWLLPAQLLRLNTNE